MPLHFTTYTFAKGHRIRLTVSNAQFPMLWPTPYRVPTKLAVGERVSSLTLPVLTSPGKPADFLLKPVELPLPSDFTLFSGADLGNAPPPMVSREGKWVKVRQEEEQHWKMRDTTYFDREAVIYRVDPADPASAGFAGEGYVSIERKGRKIEIVTALDVESDLKDFHIIVHRTIFENGVVKGDRTWKEKSRAIFSRKQIDHPIRDLRRIGRRRPGQPPRHGSRQLRARHLLVQTNFFVGHLHSLHCR